MLSADLSVLGIVFAVIIFIVFFSAVILYLAFRIKETFREEKKRGMLAVKVAFLIGILFLAGGSFYFFAQVLAPPVPANTTSPSSPPTESTNETPTGKLNLTLSVSYPSTVKTAAAFTVTFTITNPTTQTAHDVVIQTNQLLQSFELVSSTHQVIGNAIKIGDITETAICSIELTAPTKPSQIKDTITLTYKEMTEPLTEPISISITGGKK